MAYPTKNDLIRAEEVGRIQLENMVRVLDLFNTSVAASFNSKPEKKEDDSASYELGQRALGRPVSDRCNAVCDA